MTEAERATGVVFNIQRYSIHDGPGIRTVVFLKGCPLVCFWCQNPESQLSKPEIFLSKQNCTHCGRCIDVCPVGANSLSTSSSEIDRGKCLGCGKCAKVCPSEARRLVGKVMTIDEVMQEIVKDMNFFKTSGGGVTLSGGDPIVQTEFALAILQSCKQIGIHTTLETCGQARWPTMERLLMYVDLVLYDIKHMDTTMHYRATGKNNEFILENIKRIAGYKPMMVRVPLIPGFNDSPEEIGKIACFAKLELNSTEVNLLPYNKLGEGKYKRLDRIAIPLEMQSEAQVEALRGIISKILG